ncbi:MAG: phosphatase PAP2 family protein [Proteobacteria bacterium]|nr:phosphatase PAP2 family protein [Pseudomonadota bacterium]
MSTANNTFEFGITPRGFSLGAFFAWSRERALFRLAHLGFDIVFLAAMAVMLVATVLAMGGSIRFFQASVGLPLAIMVVALVTAACRRPGEWRDEVRHILRDWVPFLFIVFIYENMHDVAGQAMSFDIAGTLHDWDVALFGMEPTLWMQRFYSPLATDIFAVSYALYFAEPLVIMFLLSIWDMRQELRHMAMTVTLTFILGFIGYVFLPASPPRYFIEHLFTDPIRLQGQFIFNHLQGAWDSLSVVAGGAFPSLHVAISTVALIYAWRYRKLNRTCSAIWYAYVPLVTSLWVATVYLRHHWVIDIFAGWAVAGIAYAGTELLARARAGLCARYGLSV